MNLRKRAVRGFTMIETLSSAAVLSLVVFAAVGASKAAMQCTGEVVSLDAETGRASSSLDRLRALLLSASADSLSGTPASGNGVVLEPMQDAVAYGDLSFRTVTGYADGGPVYVPALDQPAYRLHRTGDPRASGELVLETGRSSTILLDDVLGLTIRRSGKELHLMLETASASEHESATYDLGVVLLVP